MPPELVGNSWRENGVLHSVVRSSSFYFLWITTDNRLSYSIYYHLAWNLQSVPNYLKRETDIQKDYTAYSDLNLRTSDSRAQKEDSSEVPNLAPQSWFYCRHNPFFSHWNIDYLVVRYSTLQKDRWPSSSAAIRGGGFCCPGNWTGMLHFPLPLSYVPAPLNLLPVYLLLFLRHNLTLIHAVLELLSVILLPQLPQCWDYKHDPPYPASFYLFYYCFCRQVLCIQAGLIIAV